mgnify:CR=1 FL=1
MKPFRSRGRRIRPTDKDLVFHTALAALLPVFLLIVLLFHAGQLRRIDWQHASLSQMVQGINLPYLLFSLGIAGLLCLGDCLCQLPLLQGWDKTTHPPPKAGKDDTGK